MWLGASFSLYNPVAFVIPLLAAESAEIALGSSVLVSTEATGPGVSSSSRNPGNLAANSGGFQDMYLLGHPGHPKCTNQNFIQYGS